MAEYINVVTVTPL